MKLTVFFLINLKKKITIILVMLPLKMVVVDKVDLEVLGVLVVQIFQTYLRIFLATSAEEEAPKPRTRRRRTTASTADEPAPEAEVAETPDAETQAEEA